MDSTLPTGKLSRGKIVGKALFKIGVKKSKTFLANGDKEKNQEEIADIIFDALGELKGVSVKIAQQVALSMPFLPPVYLEKISKSFNAIPSINKALVRKIIKTELDKYPQEAFDSFNMESFAAASLGQVHLATKDGKHLAVKVQYPGIRKSIESDMSIIYFVLKRLAKGEGVNYIVEEIKSRLYEETDYALEAKNYIFFKENIDNKNIIIPKVYPKLSSKKVLTTSLLNGLDLKGYLATNPNQEEKNTYAQLIFDNFFYTLYHLKRVHADPNPGNFLFLENGRLGLIDFGCVKQVNDKFLKKYNALHLSLIEGSEDEELVSHYQHIGMISKDTPEKMLHFYREVIKPLDKLYIEPLIEDSYDFGIHNDFTKRGLKCLSEVQKQNIYTNQISKEYIFLDRTLLGYYAIFEQMGARIYTKNVKEMMNQYSVPTLTQIQ
jgi:predicted unusual protein kinase regulating ubiquinone biosynthesis (AarF/ABC1/UbiB family)